MTLEIHPGASVSKLADIEDSTRGSVIRVGDRSVIDSFVKIKPAGGSGDVIIGDRVTVNSGCVIYTGNGLIIGNDTAIAANCVFAPVNHEFGSRGTLIRDQRFQPSRGGIVIEDDVWIGAGCVFLDGTILRKGCVIGASSLVRGEIPAYALAVGNPAKVVGERA